MTSISKTIMVLPNGEKLKKNKNAFMFYRQENIERIKAENPDAKMTEQTVILGEEWRALTEDQKSEYQTMAEEDKTRYEAEKLTATETAVEPKKKRNAKAKKE
jgi:hypothetical protein